MITLSASTTILSRLILINLILENIAFYKNDSNAIGGVFLSSS